MYNPANWYWIGRPDGRQSDVIYSSAKGAIVAANDSDYVAWAKSNVATPWPSDAAGAKTAAALDDVLGAHGLPATSLAVPTQAQLLAYANNKQWALAVGGFTVHISGTPYRFATDDISLTMMNGKVARLSQPSPPASFNWQVGPNTWLTISAANFTAAATACADFVQATFDELKVIQAAILAGTITTYAAIDAAAWPENTQ